MTEHDEDARRLAEGLRWLSPAQCSACSLEVDRCAALGLPKSFSEICLEKRFLTREQVDAIEEKLGIHPSGRIGEYQPLRRIGVGGSGSVFEAEHVRLKHRVALKLLSPRLARSRRVREQFLLEGRILARLNHPNLVYAQSAGHDGGRYYLAMELVEGENLLQLLTRQRSGLEVERALQIVTGVCKALSALEEAGIVHHDVKPSNILVGPGVGVKLVDLGTLRAEETNDAWVSGTPHYVAPENLLPVGNVDSRADVYSLGATWYQLLSGRTPFSGRSSRDVLYDHLNSQPPDLRKLRPDVPSNVANTIARWMSKDPADRPRGAREALRELEGLARALGFTRVPAAELVRPLPRRGRRRVIAVTTVVGLVLAIAAAVWAFVRTDPEPGPMTAGETPGEAASEVATLTAPRAARESRRGAARVRPAATGEREPETTRLPERPRAETPGAETSTDRPPESPSPQASARPAVSPARSYEVVDAVYGVLQRASEKTLNLGSQVIRLVGETLNDWTAADRDVQLLSANLHAARVGLARMGDRFGVALAYEFDGAEELRDFRLPRGVFSIRHGILSAPGGTGESFADSVFWLVPPLQLTGRLTGTGTLTIGLGELRASLFRRGDHIVWTTASSSPVFGVSRPGRSFEFMLEITDSTIVIREPGSKTLSVDVPIRGRLTIGVDGIGIDMLAIDGWLEPTWARSRAAHLAETR